MRLRPRVQRPSAHQAASVAFALEVHGEAPEGEKALGLERLGEEVGNVVERADERHLELELLHHVAHIEVAALHVLGAVVVLRVVGEVAGARVVGREVGRPVDRGAVEAKARARR